MELARIKTSSRISDPAVPNATTRLSSFRASWDRTARGGNSISLVDRGGNRVLHPSTFESRGWEHELRSRLVRRKARESVLVPLVRSTEVTNRPVPRSGFPLRSDRPFSTGPRSVSFVRRLCFDPRGFLLPRWAEREEQTGKSIDRCSCFENSRFGLSRQEEVMSRKKAERSASLRLRGRKMGSCRSWECIVLLFSGTLRASRSSQSEFSRATAARGRGEGG